MRVAAGFLCVALLGLTTACGGAPPRGVVEVPAETRKLPVYQDKYVALTLGCLELADSLPDLPPLQKDDDEKHWADLNLQCEFHDEKVQNSPFVDVTLSVWKSDPEDLRYSAQVGRGPSRARDWFGDRPSFIDAGASGDITLGEKTKWQRTQHSSACYLTILDENAVLQLAYRPGGDAEVDPLSEECRGPLRKLATPIYDAVQP